jgi:acetyl-CoA C-acetyltransferase
MAIDHFGRTPAGQRWRFKRVTGTAGAYQVEDASNFATLNIGGGTKTTVSLIVGR